MANPITYKKTLEKKMLKC